MNKKELHEKIENINNSYRFYLNEFDLTFGKDEEKSFAKTLESFVKTGSKIKSDEYTKKKYYLQTLKDLFIYNQPTWNDAEVWNKISFKIYNEETIFIFKSLINRIDFATFDKKAFQCKDPKMAYELYSMFRDSHNMKNDLFKTKYSNYLENYVIKNNSSYEELLNNCLNEYLKVYRNKTLKDMIIILIDKANLYYEFNDKKNSYSEKEFKTSLQDKIALRIGEYLQEDDKDIITALLKKSKKLYFKEDKNEIDACKLNLNVNNSSKAKKVFASRKYELYSKEQLNALKNYGEFDYNEFGKIVDRFDSIISTLVLNDNDATKNTVISLLFSGKIKMININKLNIIKDYLGKTTYNKFMKYIKQNDVMVYYYSNGTYKVTDNIEKTIEQINFENEKLEKELRPKRLVMRHR